MVMNRLVWMEKSNEPYSSMEAGERGILCASARAMVGAISGC